MIAARRHVAWCFLISALFVIGSGVPGISFPAPQETASPVAECVPPRPKPGDRIEIRYHASLGESRFSPNEAVYAAVTVVFQEHGFSSKPYRLSREGDELVTRLLLPSNAACLTAYFLTLSSESYDATPLVVPISAEDGRPVRNALASCLDGTNALKYAAEELRLYPDNLAVYRNKWFFLSTGGEPDSAGIIARDMITLQSLRRETAEFYFALSYGHLLLKDEPKGREALKRMLLRFPQSPLTGVAISSYFYQTMANPVSVEAQADMDKAIEQAAAEFPGSPGARAWISLNRPCPVDLIIRIADAWIADDEDDPYPYQLLAVVLKDIGRDMDRAAGAIEKSLDLTLRGGFRLHYDLFGKRTDFHLGNLYLTAGAIRLALGNHVRALAFLQTARRVPGVSPKVFFLEGEVWSAVGNLKAAERAYAEAWNKGLEAAGDKLRAIFQATRKPGASGDFEVYLKTFAPERNASTSSQPSEAKAAPAFTATDLTGAVVDLRSLRGKVVVLNFWYVGCAPCKAEIADLNRLVTRFPDAVFIAPALTDPAALRPFLADNPFRYRVIPSAANIARIFGVKAYPTHVIIDRQGNIFHQRFGGGPSVYDELAPVLERLFK